MHHNRNQSSISTLKCISGEEPFSRAKAADYLEKLARGDLDIGQPLTVDNILPAPGPAVGHGFLASTNVGLSFEPAA